MPWWNQSGENTGDDLFSQLEKLFDEALIPFPAWEPEQQGSLRDQILRASSTSPSEEAIIILDPRLNILGSLSPDTFGTLVNYRQKLLSWASRVYPLRESLLPRLPFPFPSSFSSSPFSSSSFGAPVWESAGGSTAFYSSTVVRSGSDGGKETTQSERGSDGITRVTISKQNPEGLITIIRKLVHPDGREEILNNK